MKAPLIQFHLNDLCKLDLFISKRTLPVNSPIKAKDMKIINLKVLGEILEMDTPVDILKRLESLSFICFESIEN